MCVLPIVGLKSCQNGVQGRHRELKNNTTREVVAVTVGKAIGGNHGIRHDLLSE
jgi:hypothetical protein